MSTTTATVEAAVTTPDGTEQITLGLVDQGGAWLIDSAEFAER